MSTDQKTQRTARAKERLKAFHEEAEIGKAQEFDVTASDLNAKARAQAARVDGMVTSVLNTTAEITETIQKGIKVPVREVSGLMNGLKAGLDVLVGRAKGSGNGRGNVPRDPGW